MRAKGDAQLATNYSLRNSDTPGKPTWQESVKFAYPGLIHIETFFQLS